MPEYIVKILEGLGVWGLGAVIAYFVISKIPTILQSLNEISERRLNKLKDLSKLDTLPADLKPAIDSILLHELMSRAIGITLSEYDLKKLYFLYESIDKKVSLNELITFKEYFEIDSSKNEIKVINASQELLDMHKNLGNTAGFISQILIVIPIVFFVMELTFPILPIFHEIRLMFQNLTVVFFAGFLYMWVLLWVITHKSKAKAIENVLKIKKIIDIKQLG